MSRSASNQAIRVRVNRRSRSIPNWATVGQVRAVATRAKATATAVGMNQDRRLAVGDRRAAQPASDPPRSQAARIGTRAARRNFAAAATPSANDRAASLVEFRSSRKRSKASRAASVAVGQKASPSVIANRPKPRKYGEAASTRAASHGAGGATQRRARRYASGIDAAETSTLKVRDSSKATRCDRSGWNRRQRRRVHGEPALVGIVAVALHEIAPQRPRDHQVGRLIPLGIEAEHRGPGDDGVGNRREHDREGDEPLPAPIQRRRTHDRHHPKGKGA